MNMADLSISKDKLDILGKLNVMAENLTGAFSLRVDGSPYAKGSSANVTITAKKDLPGIDIRVKAGTKGEKIHIPVILTQTGIKDLVYNDFYIGENCDVEIVAGCGIHNHGHEDSAHDGIHSFHIGKNARVFYSEKHYGESTAQSGKNIMNPTTIIDIAEGGYMEMDTVQISGVDNTIRKTKGKLGDGAVLKITERIMTDGEQYAETQFEVDLSRRCGLRYACDFAFRGAGQQQAALYLQRQRQQPMFRSHRMRRHHHGCGFRQRGAEDQRQFHRRVPHSRGGHRQDCGRTAGQADDAGSDRKGSRRPHYQRIYSITCRTVCEDCLLT